MPDKLRNLEPASGDPARPGPVKPESDLLAEAREAFGNLPARKQVPGVGEMYFPEVLPSPHTGRDEQEPEAEDPEGPVIRDKDARRVLV